MSLLRYDVYDDIVDLSQTFLVVEEVSCKTHLISNQTLSVFLLANF